MSKIKPDDDEIMRAAMGDLGDAGDVPAPPSKPVQKPKKQSFTQPDYDPEVLKAAAGDLGDDVFDIPEEPKNQSAPEPQPSTKTPKKPKPHPKKRSRKWLGALVAVLVVALIGGGAFLIYDSSHINTPPLEDVSTEDDHIDFEANEAIKSELKAAEAPYVTGGYVFQENKSKAIKAVENTAEKLKKNGKIVDYKADENSVCFERIDGTMMIYVPRVPGVLSGGGDGRVITFEPFKNEFTSGEQELKELINEFGDGQKMAGVINAFNEQRKVQKYFDASAVSVSNINKEYTFKSENNLDDEAVTVNRVKKLAGSSVIIWSGHGFWNKYYNIHGLCLSQKAKSYATTKENRLDFKYKKNKQGKIIKFPRLIEDDDGEIWITEEFIKYYFKNDSFEGAMIYLGACYSGRKMSNGSTIADAFCEKGAECVFANDEESGYIYSAKMLKTIINEMVKGKTAEKALEKAKKKHGAIYTTSEGIKSRLLIFGTKSYKLLSGNTKSTTAAPLVPTTQPQDWDDIPAVDNPEDTGDDDGSDDNAFIDKLCAQDWETVDEGDFTFYTFNGDGTVTVNDNETVEYTMVSDNELTFSVNESYYAEFTVTNTEGDGEPNIRIVYGNGYVTEGPLLERDFYE